MFNPNFFVPSSSSSISPFPSRVSDSFLKLRHLSKKLLTSSVEDFAVILSLNSFLDFNFSSLFFNSFLIFIK